LVTVRHNGPRYLVLSVYFSLKFQCIYFVNIIIIKDILKDQWSPALTIKTALLSLLALLTSPEATDPQDAEVAKMYISDRKKFEKTAKFWTETYAKPIDKEGIISRITDMGFDRESANKALEKHEYDESAAVNELLMNC